jgi:hypothetical protein
MEGAGQGTESRASEYSLKLPNISLSSSTKLWKIRLTPSRGDAIIASPTDSASCSTPKEVDLLDANKKVESDCGRNIR